MEKITSDKVILKKFGLTMALCFAAITLVVFFKRQHSLSPAAIISLAFLLLALGAPVLLKYFYYLWMKLAFILGWVNTRLLLCAVFYFIFFPLGLILRLFKVNLLERSFRRSGNSYWEKKEKKEFSPADYQRQS